MPPVRRPSASLERSLKMLLFVSVDLVCRTEDQAGAGCASVDVSTRTPAPIVLDTLIFLR